MKDKIYVDKFGQSIEGHIPEGSDLVTEYIRKDALLKWANREDVEILKKIPSDGNVWSNGYLCGMKDLIDKLNSL